jgi:integrase
MKANYKIVYNRKKRFNKSGEALIQIVVYIPNVGRKYLSTGIYIKPGEWDDRNKKVKKIHSDYANINRILYNTVKGLEEYEYKIISAGKTFSFADLERYLTQDNIATSSFIDFFENEIQLNKVAENKTRREHKYTLTVLKEFQNNITFNDVNYQFAQDFDNFLRIDKKLSQNTIHKHHAHIKRFLNIATKKEIYDYSQNSYKEFHSQKVKSDRENLTAAQVTALEQLEIPEHSMDLKQIRDMFLFSCYAGLRYSDIQALKIENVRNDNNGISIRFKMEKVDRFIELPLYSLFDKKPEQILKYYLAASNSDTIFPRYTNQHTNRILKALAIVAKIETKLTFHIARHTFGTFLAEKTCNPYLIMDLMGHTDIKTSMIYIHRSQERINRQLKDVNWALS